METATSTSSTPARAPPRSWCCSAPGDGSFAAPVSYPVDGGPDAIVLADVDGDQQLDVVVASQSWRTLSVLLGQGAMGLAPSTQVRLAVSAETLASGDLTGDGLPNLVLATPYSPLQILVDAMGTGFPAWAGITIPAGVAPSAMTAADFNADGRVDLAVADPDGGSVGLLFGTAAGGFEPAVLTPTGLHPGSLAAADVNGDLRPDVVVVDYDAGVAEVLLNTGSGLAKHATYPTGGSSQAMTLADLDGDGNADIAVANVVASGLAGLDGDVGVLFGHGDGTFAAVSTIAVGIQPTALVAGDFTGDGRTGLAVASLTEVALIFASHGDLTSSVVLAPAGGFGWPPKSIVAADLDGDGKTDLAVTLGPQDLSILIGHGDGTFAAPVTYSLRVTVAQIVAADVNGDGKVDLVGVDGSTSVFMLVNEGSGTFGAPISYVAGNGPSGLIEGPSWIATANAAGGNVSLLPIPCSL